jgi:hypothetical protein
VVFYVRQVGVHGADQRLEGRIEVVFLAKEKPVVCIDCRVYAPSIGFVRDIAPQDRNDPLVVLDRVLHHKGVCCFNSLADLTLPFSRDRDIFPNHPHIALLCGQCFVPPHKLAIFAE